MEVSKLTRKSHYYNEDRFLCFKNAFMVIDGATSLMPSSLKPTSGSFLASYIKRELPKLKGSVEDRLVAISKEIANKYDFASEAYLPSAGLAFCELVDEKVKITTLGDCEALVVYKNGHIQRFVQNELIDLDNLVFEKMKKLAKEKNISIKDTLPFVKSDLIKHRKMMNKKDGYNVYAPYKEPNFKFLKATIDIKDISYIYLFTDGFASIFDCYHLYSLDDLFSSDIDINKIVEQIVSLSYSDPSFNKYPRFKIIDDITVIKIKF